ncbi:MAG: hypothetical protein WCV73_02380 [Patescibacteria group bacterium]|jgi:hypothetical protein
MKNLFKLAVFSLILAMPIISLAAEFRAGDTPSIGRDEAITNDVYMGGGNVTSAGSISGDLITGGGNIVISGDVGADIIVAGNNISILSNIGDDVRAVGNTVIITGHVEGDLLAGGGQIVVSGVGVGGDVVIGGGNIRLDAPVSGNLLIGGGTVYINSAIGGNVKIDAEKITFGKNAVISGNVTYKSIKEMVKEDGVTIKGSVDFKLREKKTVSHQALLGIFSAFMLWKFLALLACSLVIGLSFKRYSKEIVALAVKKPWLELGRGLIVMIVTPIISIMLLFTLVGIPFGILGLLAYVIMMMFAWMIAPIILGSVVYGYFAKKEFIVSWKTILLGTLIFVLLGLVPFIGCFAQALLMFITLGAIIALKLHVIKDWR